MHCLIGRKEEGSVIACCCRTTYEPAQKFPNLIFLKELSFRTSDTKHASRVVQVRYRGPHPGAGKQHNSRWRLTDFVTVAA
jgi:hypothetical protein